ncbi:ComF family protein [Aestuariimicrobium kwangyangense]|uniref:ComF family protein n=1 Tax=Aestuariimicrobium kwangyangense TaxID=396389 RepID=UPI0003B3BAFE|nr:ComF family protein [Aestuariimicrobium kwangyangense]
MEPRVRALLDATADLFLGSSCPGCGRPGWGACGDCLAALARPTPLRLVGPAPGWPVVAACSYRPPVPALVKAWKDEGGWGLTRPFAEAVSLRVGLAGWCEPMLVVPVPSRSKAVAERGHDHARALARAVARRLGWSHEPLLRVARSGSDQFDLGRTERWQNMAAAMRAQSGSGRVLLVDDVITTGASLTAAATALTRAGWTVSGAATVASSELRHAQSTPRQTPAG